MPRISVVLPTYNRETMVQNAIRSIIDQTFTDWELVIVDDGSTDGTKRVVESFAMPNIKFISLQHTGHITKIRNIGNQAAKGELIVVQDSDDMSMPNRLEEVWNAYEKTDADVLYHWFFMRFYDPYHNAICRKVKKLKPFDLDELLKTQYIPGQVAYKRKKILETPYNEEIVVADDYVMLLELALKKNKFHLIRQYLYDYLESQDSLNIQAESDGRRQKDALKIEDILRTKYKIDR